MFGNSSQPGEAVTDRKPKAFIARFLEEFGIVRRALVHPRVPWHAKAVSGCALLYIVSPIQLLPNFIPVIGQMDDVAVIALALKYLRRSVPPSILEECRRPSSMRAKSAGDTGREDAPSTAPAVITSPPGLQ